MKPISEPQALRRFKPSSAIWRTFYTTYASPNQTTILSSYARIKASLFVVTDKLIEVGRKVILLGRLRMYAALRQPILCDSKRKVYDCFDTARIRLNEKRQESRVRKDNAQKNHKSSIATTYIMLRGTLDKDARVAKRDRMTTTEEISVDDSSMYSSPMLTMHSKNNRQVMQL